MSDNPQDAVFALLLNPDTHGGATMTRIDTHAASVFLAGARAYKVKRAVRYPFLDYSTLEKRKAACEAELGVNRRFAPQLYRRVVAITREADGRLALDGHGTPVEWAVEMERFDENQTLDHLAARGALNIELAARLGAVVAAVHAAAPLVAPKPWIGALADYIEQNDQALRQHPECFAASDVAAFTQASRMAFAAARPLLEARGALGLIRRGHGDLHLRNIVLIDGEPVLFDAVEFDPLVASGDLLYDLAFLLMDLMHGGLGDAANTVLNAYLAASGRQEDLDGLKLLPLLLSVRAAIRAKVTAARMALKDMAQKDSEGAPGAIAEEAHAYFQLARRLINPPPPRLIAVGGLSGTGKSTLARRLAPSVSPLPGAVLLRSDIERKALHGTPETKPLPPQAYTAEVTARVYGILCDKARRVLAAGHSAVVDAVFAAPGERRMVEELAHESSVPFQGLFLTAPLSVRLTRVETRHADASDAGRAVVTAQEDHNLGEIDWGQVDASASQAETFVRARAAADLRDIPYGAYLNFPRRPSF